MGIPRTPNWQILAKFSCRDHQCACPETPQAPKFAKTSPDAGATLHAVPKSTRRTYHDRGPDLSFHVVGPVQRRYPEAESVGS